MLKQSSYLFSGHETFALKYEWLRKFYDLGDMDLKEDEDLIGEFGVGKNMLNSMRYWAKLSGLFEYDGRRRCIVPQANKWGQLIFEQLDPYLEKNASTWFLHWKMIFGRNAYTPFWLFCHNNTTVFDVQYVLSEIKMQIDAEQQPLPADETLRRDIETYLKCYCPKTNKSNEEVDHILSDLHLITHAQDGTNRYQMSYQRRPSLNFRMFLFALLDYKKEYYSETKTIPMEKIMYGQSSPGRIFKVDESSINLYSEDINQYTDGQIYLDESAGVYQWLFEIEAQEMASMQKDLFKSMYETIQ